MTIFHYFLTFTDQMSKQWMEKTKQKIMKEIMTVENVFAAALNCTHLPVNICYIVLWQLMRFNLPPSCFYLHRSIQSAAQASPSSSRVVWSCVRQASRQGRSSSTFLWKTGWTCPPSRPACPATQPASPALALDPQTACPAHLTATWSWPPVCTRTRSSVNLP